MRPICWVLAVLVACVAAADEKHVVCYFGSSAVYRPGLGGIQIPDIDANLCTHLIYTFAGITEKGGVHSLDPWADLPDQGGKDGYRLFNELRKQNPALKTLIAVGGWNEGSVKYSRMAASPETRKNFVENALKFVKKHKFNGLDFDWEYPTQAGGSPIDKRNYGLLLKELKETFSKEGLLVTAAVAASRVIADSAYDVPEISKHLDLINVMTYDFHGVWDKKTGINSPLYAKSSENGDDVFMNVNASISYWLSQGAPASKLVLGVPFYGRSFTLDYPSSEDNGLGAPAQIPGQEGPYTRQAGSLGYNEICEAQLTEKWLTRWEEEQKVPYAVKGSQWVGYDDPRSVKEKAEFAKKLGLAGVMVWSIETDDFRNTCDHGKYPLLKALNSALRG